MFHRLVTGYEEPTLRRRFAYAGDVVAATLAGTVARQTTLYEVGAQFAF